MQVKPNQSYKSPNYPTLDIVIREPAWLRSNIPASWKGKEHIAQMLSVLLFGATMMPNDFLIGELKLPKEVIARMDSLKIKAVNDNKQAAVSVAPIFEHGGGRGATGCVVISPPVFLSEEDARQVIEQELKANNINITKHDYPIDEIQIEQKEETYSKVMRGTEWDFVEKDSVTGSASLVVDGIAPENNFCYLFIASDDCTDLGQPYSFSTVHDYDTKEIAVQIRKKLIDYGKINVAVFYDPMPDFVFPNDLSKDYKKSMRENQKIAKGLLKFQVSDFIEWLKKTNISNRAK